MTITPATATDRLRELVEEIAQITAADEVDTYALTAAIEEQCALMRENECTENDNPYPEGSGMWEIWNGAYHFDESLNGAVIGDNQELPSAMRHVMITIHYDFGVKVIFRKVHFHFKPDDTVEDQDDRFDMVINNIADTVAKYKIEDVEWEYVDPIHRR